MAFPDSLSPHGDATASRFDPVAGDFAGMPRDLPGPMERGPVVAFWPLPAGSPAVPPVEGPATDPLKASPPTTPIPELQTVSSGTLPNDWLTGIAVDAPSVLPAETALSLKHWSMALVGSSRAGSAPASLALPPVAEGQNVSLAALAEHLSARLVHGVPESTGEVDFWHADPPAPPAVRPGGLLEVMDWEALSPKVPDPNVPQAPDPAHPLAVREAVAVAAAAVSSPAGIRAAVGLLANPPKSSPEPRQGDVFFLDHPAAAHPAAVASGLEPGDFLLASPVASEATPLASALAGQAERADPLPGPWGLQVPDPDVSEAPASTRPPPLPLPRTGLPTANPTADGAGTGLVIGGTGLILLGIWLACRLPLIWLEYRSAWGWPQQMAASSLLVHAGGSLVALIAGAGSIYLQRWAVTLVLAAGWLSVFTAALLIGIAAFLLGSETPVHFHSTSAVFLLGGLLVPLVYLLYYEKQLPGVSPGAPAAAPADPALRSVPLLMLVLSGMALALTAAAMLRHPPALPWPGGQVITGPPAEAAWTALLVAGVLTAFCAWHRRPVAWWLLLLATAGLCATLSVSSLGGTPRWETFLTALGRPDSAGLPDPFWPAAAGLAPLIPGLVLLMTRRSLPSPPPP